ncbi:MAG: S49 family peptidase [candidate division Zixibacteria bacterium]|nr:S49 family peptidase [candidate division Zixibacteria bacterium]
MADIWAIERNYILGYLDKKENHTYTQEDLSAFGDALDTEGSDNPLLIIEGETAHIEISGPLSRKGPDYWDRVYGDGGTSYTLIIEALKLAVEDESIKEIRLKMNTPGGTVDGVDEVAQMVAFSRKKKKVIAENHGMIASGGYWIASQASKIVAMSPGAETGSIGVIIVGYDFSEALKQIGIKKHFIVSENAPRKAATLETKKGRNILQDRVDSIERVFMSRIAEGRKISIEVVRETFGRGDVLIAKDPDPDKKDALSVGMIDAVEGAIKTPPVEESGDDTPLKVVDIPWNSSKAIQKVREHTNSLEKPSSSYKKAFFWFNAEEPNLFESYKLPFATVQEGGLVAVKEAILLIHGILIVPKSERKGVRAQINEYKKHITGGKKVMALKDLMIEDNGVRLEVDALVSDAFERGQQSGKDQVTERVKKSVAFIGGDYPKSIQNLAAKVVSGESEFSALEGAVAVYDATKESDASKKAKDDPKGNLDTGVDDPNANKDVATGIVASEADIDAGVAEARKAMGRGEDN